MASVRALKENLGQIQLFVSSVGQYADGVAAAAVGAHTAKAGSAQLASGASSLYDGVLQLQNGTDQLSDGLVQFNDEGISQLTGALDATSSTPADCGGRDDQPPRRLHQLCRCTRGCVQPSEVHL